MDAKCPTCGQVIEVADTAAGGIGRCAACKSLYEVASAGRLRAVGVQGDDGSSGKGSGGDADVRYKCAKCKTVLESPSRLARQQDRCPICGHSNVVPSRRKPKKTKRREEVVFLDPDAQQEGPDAATASGEQDGNTVASKAMLDLQAASADGEARRTSAAVGGDAQDASEIPTAAHEVAGDGSDRRHAPPGTEPPADASGGPQWFYVSGGEQVGPVSFAVVRDLVRTGHLQASSMVWREGMDRWIQLGATPEYCAMPAAPMAQPPAVQQWPAQHQGYLMARERKRSGLAVASLVCSLVGVLLFGVVLGLLGIIFGGVAISKVKQNPQAYAGKGMAVAGLIIGIVDMVLGVFWIMWVFG